MSTEIPYHFANSLQVLKQSLLSIILYMYIAPGQGQTKHLGHNFDVNKNSLKFCPYVASFKMISSKSDFIQIFNDFIHVCSPEARAENPLGTYF